MAVVWLLTACEPAGVRSLSLADMEGSGEPHLSVTSDGRVVLSYLSAVGGIPELRYRTLTDRTWSEPQTITRGADLLVNWADFPAVVQVGEGLWAAQWLVKEAGAGYAYHAYAALSDDDGQTWQAPRRLHSDSSATEHGFVSLYADAAGVGAFWLDGRRYAEDDPAMELRHKRIYPAASAGTDTETIVDSLVCDCCQTDAAVTSAGAVVVYRDRTAAEIRDIYVARPVAEGWQQTRVAQDGWEINGCPVNGPAIAASGEVAVVAWFSGHPANRVQVAFSRDAAATFAPAIEIDGDTAVGRVDVALLNNHSAIVSWLRRGSGDFVFRRVDRNGVLGEISIVSPMATHRNAGFPRMVKAGDRLVFAWTDTQGEGSRVRSAEIALPVALDSQSLASP
ncbi:MAG: hypothetical protein RIC89_01900 [Pseudomonadales bacterium]